jgi:hypothetical protein
VSTSGTNTGRAKKQPPSPPDKSGRESVYFDEIDESIAEDAKQARLLVERAAAAAAKP